MAIYSRRLTEAGGYLVAVATTLAAVEIRWLLEPWLVGYLPLISLFPAVAVSVWFGGYRPALVATILGYLACSYLVIEPRGFVIPIGVAQWVGLMSYLFSCGAIIAMGEGLHAARRRAEANRLEALAHLKQLEAEVVERKQAEADMRAAEEQSRSVVNHVVDGIITMNESGQVESLNPAAEKLFGYPASEVIGRNVKMLMPEPYRQEHDTYVANYLRTGEAKIIGIGREVVGRRKDGSTFPMDLAVSEFRIGPGRFFTGIVRDISDRKRAEERLRLLWEAASVLLSTDDPGAMLRILFGKIGPHLALDSYFNFMVNEGDGALRLDSCFGIPEQAAGSVTGAEFVQAVCDTVRDRQPKVVNYIQQFDDPQAQVVKALGLRAYACYPLTAGNRLLGALAFASRTRDRFTPDELEFLQTIKHYVTVAYERLQLIGKLQEADRRKDEFLAMLGHELRNPLAPVRIALELLGHAEGRREIIEQACGIMDRQVSQMVRLVDDLLDVARIASGKLELRKERVELGTVVKHAVEASRPTIEQKGHELSVTLPPQPVYLDADPVRVTQALLNLLNNAANYTEPGGRIWLTVERHGSDAVVTVQDTGIGIAADKLSRVFDMFTQVNQAPGRSSAGLGLGLTLVKRLTEMHGGRVEVDSEGPGKGSRFTVRLPVAIGPAREARSPSPRTGGPPRCRILAVDDNRDSADSLAMMLRLLGHSVQTAYDGVEAVKTAEAFHPEVVLLDLGLPRLSGYEAARRIRQQPGGDAMILFAMTGWGQEEDRRRSQEAGFNFHLVKPVTAADLEKLLTKLMPATHAKHVIGAP
jgi:PAS domain S-box-containing protein